MSICYPLTVYYDASCPLCNSEMMAIKSCDSENILRLIDCSTPAFDDSGLLGTDITRTDLMNCLHVLDSAGLWIKGVASFELLYRSVGLTGMARFWGSAHTRPFMEWLYPWVARHRQLLSKIGLTVPFRILAWLAARRANKRSASCKQGRCSL